uniref:FMN-dependent dehydrogenase domain-containing protein n=1 Tax=Ascaris lumbricoides TaxID=6252 RepID=A0A0M3I8J4_ASCLU
MYSNTGDMTEHKGTRCSRLRAEKLGSEVAVEHGDHTNFWSSISMRMKGLSLGSSNHPTQLRLRFRWAPPIPPPFLYFASFLGRISSKLCFIFGAGAPILAGAAEGELSAFAIQLRQQIVLMACASRSIITHRDARSIVDKLPDLEILAKTAAPDIIAI